MSTVTNPPTFAESSPDTLVEPAVGGERRRQSFVNIGTTERAVSAGLGALLATAGIARRSWGGAALALLGGGLIYRGVSGHCDINAALGIDRSDRARREGAEPQDYFERGIHIEQAVTIHRTPWDLYLYWRKLENLPSIMSHLEEVRVIDESRSHWIAKAPAIAGGKVEWDAKIINDEPNALIAWRSLAGAEVDNAGSVRFVPASGDRGTEVKVVLDYIPPAGQLGRWVANLFGEEPGQQIAEDLRKFKTLMERGERGESGGGVQTSERSV